MATRRSAAPTYQHDACYGFLHHVLMLADACGFSHDGANLDNRYATIREHSQLAKSLSGQSR